MKQIFAIATAAALSACALPNETYHYYLPKSVTTISVTQTLACTKATAGKAEELVVTTSAQPPVTTYSANQTLTVPQPFSLDLQTSAFEGDHAIADTDLTIGFYDDGRLKSLNATDTGEGETALKSAIALGTALSTFAGTALFASAHVDISAIRIHTTTSAPPPPPPICKTLDNWPKDKSVQLSYTAAVSLDTIEKNKVITLDPDGAYVSVSDPELYDRIKGQVPTALVLISDRNEIKNIDKDTEPNKDVFQLTLQNTATVRLDYYTCEPGKCSPGAYANAKWAFGATVLVPVDGSLYQIDVPKARTFGNAKLSLALAESGAVQSIEYGRASGAAGAMNVAAAAATAATPAPPSQAPSDQQPVNKIPTDSTRHPIPAGGGHS